jgi:hypothetical protein
MQAAFTQVKQLLCSATCLAHPNPSAPVSLATDASETHVGAVLQQWEEGAWRPLAFYSKKLDKAQAKYSAFDRELLAAFLAVRHFRCMLEGNTFTLYTDHKPLTFALSKVAEPWTARQQRQLSFLSEFTSDIQHVAGKDNVVADALSRPVNSIRAQQPTQQQQVDYLALAAAQASCADCEKLRGSATLTVREHVVDGIKLLCDFSTGVARPLVPTCFRAAVFSALHGIAHPGIRASRRLISSRFVWPAMAADVAARCRDCVSCGRSKVQGQRAAPVEPIEVPARQFTHVHVDLVGPLPASQAGHTYLFTIIDRATRWMEAIPVADISAAGCAACLFTGTWRAADGRARGHS